MNNFNNSKYKGNGLTFNNNNNNGQSNKNEEEDLFSAPLNFSGGLGSAPAFKGMTRSHAAPTMFDAHGFSEISDIQPMANAKQQQTVINSKVMIAPNSAFGDLQGLDTTPISFGNDLGMPMPMGMKQKPALMVLPS